MKNKILTLILIVLFCVGIGYWFIKKFQIPASKIVSESIAIEIVKNQFPEFKEYPSNQLPPKSIKTEKTNEGWHIAFIQEGSGRPIISANCFFIDNQKNIVSQRIYNPTIEEDSTVELSPITCTPGACSLENCHGLDIKCGSNPPDFCTEIYLIGDKCLQYAKCGVQNDKCQQIENSQFTECKLCVQKCIDANENDNIKLFECEGKCK